LSTTRASKKILLTTLALSAAARELLSRETHDEYDVRLTSDLQDHEEFSRVEVILLDTARGEQLSAISAESLSRFPNLKLIQSTRAGVDALDFDAIPTQVTVCGNIGAYGDQIAEHVFGMILYFARNLGVSNEALAKGIWQIPLSMYLRGKTIVILGTGGIGAAVSRLATCYGMKTIGVNSDGRSIPTFGRVVALEALEGALGDAEVVVIALPLTVKTFHLIEAAKLRVMKPSCILINVARGYLLDERVLYEHLKANPQFKCGLDVWWHYPKKGEGFAQRFPFFELPNFLGTPHDSGIVPETEEIALSSAVGNVGCFVRHEPLKGVMNRNDYLGLKELISRTN
jgi:phosphoglycerate dehydrogenase-like enzyme